MSNLVYQGQKVHFAGKQINIPNANLHNGLVAYWKLDEVDGSIRDYANNITDVSHGSTVTFNQDGKINKSLLFTNGGYVQFSNAEELKMAGKSFSIAGWVYVVSDSSATAGCLIGGEVGSFGSLILENKIYVGRVGIASTWSGLSIIPDEWTFIAVVHDFLKATNNFTVYRNTDCSTRSSSKAFTADAASNLLGIFTLGVDASLYFNYYVDEIGIWDRVLSATEVSTLYNNGTGKTFPFMSYRQNLLSNLLAYYKLDGSTGSTAIDSTGRFNANIEYPTWEQTGKIGTSVKFTASDSHHASLEAMCPYITNKFSVSAWLKIPPIDGMSKTVFTTTGIHGSIQMFRIGDNGTWYSRMMPNPASYSYQNTSPSSGEGTWCHFVSTFDRDGSLEMYINNVKSANTKDVAPLSASDFTSQEIRFGPFRYGTIDEIAVWNKVLSADEVSELYNYGVGRTYPFTYTKKLITDDFESYSTGNLGGQGNWVCINGECLITDVSGDNRFTSDGEEDCERRSETFSDDQYAQVRIDAVAVNSDIGVAVRCSGSSVTDGYYFMYYGGFGSHKVGYTYPVGQWIEIDGAPVSGLNVGDILRLEIVGTELRAYRNGSLDTELFNGTGTYDASTIIATYPALAHGSVGIAAYNGGNGDDFVGGEL
jgi:hypothetical protein